MTLREEIVGMSRGTNALDSENIGSKVAVKNFMKAFNEDVKVFGYEDTVDLYAAFYEMEELKKLEVINEDTLLEVQFLNETQAADAGAIGTGGTRVGPVKATGFDPGSGMSRTAAAAAANAATNKLSLFDKIKGFFAKGFSSIANFFKSGNWKAVVGSPLFKGALAVGGVAAAVLALKKLLGSKGKKLTPEQEAAIRAEAQKKADELKAKNTK